MGKAQTQPEYPRGLDFEQVWAALMEGRKQQEETARILKEVAESHKETDRFLKEVGESHKETDRFLKEVGESHKETARILKEIGESQKETDRSNKDLSKKQEETDRFNKEFSKKQEETDRQLKENRDDFYRRLGALTNLFGEFTEHMVAPKLREKFKEFGLIFPKANPNASVNDTDNKIYLEIDVMLENGYKALLVETKTKLTCERIDKHIDRLEKMRKYADLHGDRRTFLGAVAGVVVTDEARNYALDQGFYLIEPSGESFNITPPNCSPKEW